MHKDGAQQILPERIEPNDLLLRRWTPKDAEALGQAVAQNAGMNQLEIAMPVQGATPGLWELAHHQVI
jgi:hypothetical protein